METSGARTRNLYDPASDTPFRLSRSKIELFVDCPRCFYLDRRLGVSRIDSAAYSLNNTVDLLLKKEFDLARKAGQPHALMETFGVDAVPFDHPDMEAWRDVRRGVTYLDERTNFLVFGAVDDVWINALQELFVVDYKATSTDAMISLDGQYRSGYKRQLEVYQWLFRRNGFTVNRTGYFVFANAHRGRDTFDAKLEFGMSVLPYKGDDSWIEDALMEAKLCLDREELPLANPECEWCAYRKEAGLKEA